MDKPTTLAQPPQAAQRPHSYERHGVTIEDPWAWLRDPNDKVSPLFGWRQDAFAVTGDASSERWANRSPLERAVTALVYPFVFPSERQFLELNTFRMTYGTFDWRLNDLTGGVPN